MSAKSAKLINNQNVTPTNLYNYEAETPTTSYSTDNTNVLEHNNIDVEPIQIKPTDHLQQYSKQKCSNVSQILRQQSETTHNHRRLNFSRSRAIYDYDDDDEFTGNEPSISGTKSFDRRFVSSCNESNNDSIKTVYKFCNIIFIC